MKYIFIIFVITASAIFIFNNYQKNNKAEVIINVKNLNSTQVMSQLEKDFNKQSGIKFVDGSLMANTIILEVDDNDIQISTLSQLLENWGCAIESISYRILDSFQ